MIQGSLARLALHALLVICLLPADLAAETKETKSNTSSAKLHFFSGLWDNVADTVWGSSGNIAAWFTVAGSTSIIVNTDLDLNINNAVGRSPVWSRPVDVGFLQVGNFVAAVPHTVLFIHGYFWGTHEAAAAGAAGLQALGVNGGIVLFWKWAAGRPRPVYDARLDDTPRDKEFNFNVLEQSTTSDRWRWPSGHTSSMFAMAASFHGFYPDKTWLHLITYPLATIMGFAMINGQYHWTSDVTAGAIIGTVSGYTVGRNFRRMYNKSQGVDTSAKGDKKKLEWYVMPRQLDGGMALAVSAVF